MKYILLLSMIIWNACYGQTDSISTQMININGKDYQLSIGYRKGVAVDSILLHNEIERKRDTVEVIMLYSNTAPQEYVSHYWPLIDSRKSKDTSYSYWQTDYSTYWVQGYSVREMHNEAEDTIDWWMDHNRPAQDYGVHLYYLDKNKQPLSENIIVWQSKELP